LPLRGPSPQDGSRRGNTLIPRAGLIAGVPGLVAGYFAVGVLWRGSLSDRGAVAYDFYGQFYPWAVHAWRSIGEGSGLLWNPYQLCGQPLFANIQTGLLYPVNIAFGVLPREPAFVLSIVVNLMIGGAGLYCLGRTLGQTRAAALCGAVAFQLAWGTINLAAWSPTHLGPFAWLPVAMWRCERLARAPSLRRAVALAAVLAIQLLPGFPQTVFFTYQLIGLRIAWALLRREGGSRAKITALTLLALVLPVALDAVQLLPSLEMASGSLWGGALRLEQVGPGFSWPGLWELIRSQVAVPGTVLVVFLAGLALAGALRSGPSSSVVFYAFVTVLYLILSLGPGSFVYRLYEVLPLGNAFRGSARLLWVTNFTLAALVGFGADALLRARAIVTVRIGLALATAAAAVVVLALRESGAIEAGVLFALAVALLPQRPAGDTLLRIALPLIVLANFVGAGRPPFFGLRRGDVYGTNADVFALVRQRLTAQDRVLIVGGHPDLGMMPKLGTIFRVANIQDYEPMASRAYAEFFTFMRTGRALRDIDDWYWLFGKLLLPDLQRPLFDMTAARFLLVRVELDRTAEAFDGSVRVIAEQGGIRVYENESAMTRARYVSRIAVLAPDAVLPALADGTVDVRHAAAVTQPPASGFLGSADGTGSAQIVIDEPERVVVHVNATAPGFLFLADQLYPGWHATVGGQRRDIMRANHAFRLVEVPSGVSEVVFEYRPRSLALGAVISLAAVVAAVALWRRQRD
jgi:hypothetical protein